MSLLAAALPATGQQSTSVTAGEEASRGLPLTPSKPLRFTTDEGTWMSLDVSPDGKTIVFDLLGHLYTLPIEGGTATRITSGDAFDGTPRFSPDGGAIAFVSDRSGADNLWLIDADGSGPRQLSRDEDRLFTSPAWTPDGQYIVVARSTSLLGGTYHLHLYHRDGGSGLEIAGATPTAPSAGITNLMGPAFGPDARYLYAAMRRGSSSHNHTSFQWQIGVIDRETGKSYLRTSAAGGAFRPVLSRDGRWLVYGTRRDSLTALRLRDVATGDERWLALRVQRDDQESHFSRDLLPSYAFTPDGGAIIIAHSGRFWRVGVPDGTATMIPFRANVDRMIAGPFEREFIVEDSTFTVRQIRNAVPSPDGRRLAFVAMDRLWIRDLPAGIPRRVTASAGTGEFSPAWSPDGRYLAFVTWTEHEGGDIHRIRTDGPASPERLSTQKAFYDRLAYTPGGERILGIRGPREQRRDRDELSGAITETAALELVWIPAAGGPATSITPVTSINLPHFGPDTSRIYLYDRTEGLLALRFDGTDQRTIVRFDAGLEGAEEALLSPDGVRALVQARGNVYILTSVPLTGAGPATINLVNPAQAVVPVRRLTSIGGEFAGWRRDGQGVFYSLGRSYFSHAVAGETGPDPSTEEPQRLDIELIVPRDRPRGTVVLRGARVITMKNDEVITNGDVVVREDRIAAVGPTGTVDIPTGAEIIDVQGTTILPGYVDIHAHMRPAFGVHRPHPWEYLVTLAFGTTTTRDPQTWMTDQLAYADLVEAGDFIGPRLYMTGPGIFASDNLRSLDEARSIMRRYSEFYRTGTVKQYQAGTRKVRQWIVMAAREQGLMPTVEGGLDFKKNLTEAMDGYAGIEHTMPIAPIFTDVVRLLVESGVTYTPTLVVQYGGPWAENYWYEHTDVLNDSRLLRFTPRREIDRKAVRRTGWWATPAWSFPLFARQAASVVAAGGRVGLGSHGQLQGLAVHWELWSIAAGGMPTHDVLRVATLSGAEAIGLGQSIGSIEPGKLADLQVLDANPLDDITNSRRIRYVMKNGRLHDAETMDEIWPRRRAITPLWWWTEAAGTTGR
jgi:imidazolonepropionase-like amidohydrolase/Tol biopolymer transport system component